VEPLVTADDPDWVAYQEGDESYFLRAAGELIRRYCGWHIWPSVSVTVPKLRLGSGGIIMLPSLHVTDVFGVQVGDESVDPNNYAWFEEGYVQLGVNAAWLGRGLRNFPMDGAGGGYAPDPAVARLAGVPSGLGRLAEVTMTHGYSEVPAEVKQVAFELANVASEIPSSLATEIHTPGFRLKLGHGAGGLALTAGQVDLLSSFKLSWTR